MNKDNLEKIALNFKQLTNLANKELNITEGKNKSTKLELACSKVIEILDDTPQDKNDNWVYTPKELSKMTMLVNKINKMKAEYNEANKSNKKSA